MVVGLMDLHTVGMGLATALPFSYLMTSLTVRVRMLQDSLNSGLARVLQSLKEQGV